MSTRSLAFLLLFVAAASAYHLVDDFNPFTLLDNFDFENGDDPTHGFVNYVTRQEAADRGLTKIVDGKLFIGVDSTNNVGGGRGRDSVRIQSKKGYMHGLFVLDLQHMPGGQCGAWPAFWLTNTNGWPQHGEIDVIEGVNSQGANAMALHTTPGCTIRQTDSFSGHVGFSNCDTQAPGQPANAGCSIGTDDGRTYGPGFNGVGGGVYAVEWTSGGIKIWFFARSEIPADVLFGQPNPGAWPRPLAHFTGDCDFDAHIHDQHVIFNVAFCGDWAGGVWGQDGQCNQKAPSCVDFVRNNPAAFQDAHWLINSLKVYQE